MADSRDGEHGPRLPIKVILPNQGKERPVPGGGSAPKPFRPVTREDRASLGNQVSAIQRTITPAVTSRVGSLPLRVKIIPNAIAKSHRPERLSPTTPVPSWEREVWASSLSRAQLRACLVCAR